MMNTEIFNKYGIKLAGLNAEISNSHLIAEHSGMEALAEETIKFKVLEGTTIRTTVGALNYFPETEEVFLLFNDQKNTVKGNLEFEKVIIIPQQCIYDLIKTMIAEKYINTSELLVKIKNE